MQNFSTDTFKNFMNSNTSLANQNINKIKPEEVSTSNISKAEPNPTMQNTQIAIPNTNLLNDEYVKVKKKRGLFG